MPLGLTFTYSWGPQDGFFDALEKEWMLDESAPLGHKGHERDFIQSYSRPSA